jgi:exosome complex RNA-binding protein Rrp4
MAKYRVGVVLEQNAFLWVTAENEKEAEEKATAILDAEDIPESAEVTNRDFSVTGVDEF